MKWKVLVSAPYFQPVIERYDSFFKKHDIEVVIPKVNECLSEDELLEYIDGIDGVICGDDKFTDKVLERMHKLKVISKWGTGIDSIDCESAGRRGIAVRNTPNAFTDAVADTALGFILSFARQIPWSDQEIRKDKWNKRPSVALCECTLGIIGFGNIGKAVAKRAKAFGMNILVYDIFEIPKGKAEQFGARAVILSELLKKSDFISLHCNLDHGGYHLLSKDQFAIMKKGAYLINTARGSLIDEKALVNALSLGNIGGVALDVFEEEPLPEHSPLREFTNTLFSPHNSNSSPSAWEKVHESTLNNLIEELYKNDRE